MSDFFIFLLSAIIVAILFFFAFQFAMGYFHQHLKGKREGFGGGPSSEDLARLETKIDTIGAYLLTEHKNHGE